MDRRHCRIVQQTVSRLAQWLVSVVPAVFRARREFDHALISLSQTMVAVVALVVVAAVGVVVVIIASI
jgi:hypothetical protein